jgi:hypothetical protein
MDYLETDSYGFWSESFRFVSDKTEKKRVGCCGGEDKEIGASRAEKRRREREGELRLFLLFTTATTRAKKPPHLTRPSAPLCPQSHRSVSCFFSDASYLIFFFFSL